VSTLGRLTDVEQFEDIVVKTEGARVTRLRDVARVELGGQVYDVFFQKNGKPSGGVAVFQLPGANALQVADQVRATMERLKPSFPEGLRYDIPFDTTRFVRQAVQEVYRTLFEAGALVLIVILLFLHWRAVLVPATTVPVTIIGAFAGMAAVGFSVNLLTLFGLVLAIGRGGRRHRDSRERRASYRARAQSPGRHDPGHEGGDGPGHRHHAGADGGLPPDGVSRRHHGAALPPVRAHHRHHGAHQRRQRAHAQARAVRGLPPAGDGAAQHLLPCI